MDFGVEPEAVRNSDHIEIIAYKPDTDDSIDRDQGEGVIKGNHSSRFNTIA
jgi:hypothetical protein